MSVDMLGLLGGAISVQPTGGVPDQAAKAVDGAGDISADFAEVMAAAQTSVTAKEMALTTGASAKAGGGKGVVSVAVQDSALTEQVGTTAARGRTRKKDDTQAEIEIVPATPTADSSLAAATIAPATVQQVATTGADTAKALAGEGGAGSSVAAAGGVALAASYVDKSEIISVSYGNFGGVPGEATALLDMVKTRMAVSVGDQAEPPVPTPTSGNSATAVKSPLESQLIASPGASSAQVSTLAIAAATRSTTSAAVPNDAAPSGNNGSVATAPLTEGMPLPVPLSGEGQSGDALKEQAAIATPLPDPDTELAQSESSDAAFTAELSKAVSGNDRTKGSIPQGVVAVRDTAKSEQSDSAVPADMATSTATAVKTGGIPSFDMPVAQPGGAIPTVAVPAAIPLSGDASGAITDVGGALGQQVVDMGVSGQWIDDIARQIATISNNSGQGSFRMASENLGAVRVDIMPGAEGSDIRMSVESDAALKALTRDQDRLVQDAQLASVRIGEVRIERVMAGADSQKTDGSTNGQNGNTLAHQQSGSQASSGQSNGQGGQQSSRQDMAGMNMGQSNGNNAKNPFTRSVISNNDVIAADTLATMRNGRADGTRYA